MSEEVLAKGRFRVDRRRALEKMERFQLADPRAYTLELVAAAVAAGATRIDIRNDSDDFELSWEGDGPTREELDGIFDHLFARPTTARAEMLQHLAVGILGALGQAPRWVRLDRGGAPSLRLTVDDPAETLAVEHAHGVTGTRVHVRQRLTVSSLAEALLLPLRDPEETRLLRAAARWCPVPVHVGGSPLVAPTPPKGAAAWAAPGKGALWLTSDRAAHVDVVRRGVVVGRLERPVGRLRIVGWLGGDALTLDASRGKVVEDAAWTTFVAALDAAIAALLVRYAQLAPTHPEAETPAWRAQLAEAAVWLADKGRPLGGYAALPVLTDLAGIPWSANELRAFPGPKGTLKEPGLLGMGDGCAAFSVTSRPWLDALCPGLPDLTAQLRTRAEGRTRRDLAAAERRPPEFAGAPHQLVFTEGPLRGAVRFREGASHQGDGAADLLVHLRIDGMAVDQVALPSPAGPMEAILDHRGFRTDEGFRRVEADATRAAAEAELLARAVRFATSHVERLAQGAALAPSAMAVLTAAVRANGAKARAELDGLLQARPNDRLLRAPAFTGADGRRLSLPQLLDEAAHVWILVAAVPRDCPPALAREVLVVPEALIPTWLGWFGTRARDGRATLGDDIRGAARRAGPRRVAVLDPPVTPRIAVGTGGYTGELGLDGSARPPRIDLLRAGIPVCTVSPALGLGGVVGVLDHPTLEVNRAHDALASEDTARALAGALLPMVDALARAAWDDAGEGEPPAPVLGWLMARGADVPAWAESRTLTRTVAGDPITVAGLRARASDRKAARIKFLPRDPGEVPGFDDAVVVTFALQGALEAVAPRAIRVGEAELADATRHLAAYLARPRVVEPGVLAELTEEDDGVRVRWVLPADPDRVGVMRVEARWRDRVLATRDRGESLGVLAIVEGRAITPSAALTELREPQRLHPYLKKARTRFDDVAGRALDALGDGGDVPADQRATWRGVLARLEDAKDRTRAETTLRDRIARLPLYTRLDGRLVSRDALAHATASGPVWHLPADTPPGPTDTPWYVREEPWTLRSLGALALVVHPGGPALAAWREGEARRRSLERRDAVVDGEVLVRAPISGPGFTGEVALRPVHWQGGLGILPLVNGLPLDTVTVPFPAPAAAVVTGASVRADRSFRTWSAGTDRDTAHAALLEAARALAARFTEGVVKGGLDAATGGDPTREAAWVVAYVLGDRGGPGADLPLFPLLGGGTISAAELDARGRSGGVGVVPPGGPPFVAGAPPIVVGPWLHERLSARFSLVDLSPIALRHRVRAPDVAARHAVVSSDAHVGYAGGLDAVEVRRQGVPLVTLASNGPVPIVGWVEVPEADVDPLWTGLLPACAGEVRPRLVERSRAVLAQLIEAAEGQGRAHAGTAPPWEALLTALDRVTVGVRDDAALARIVGDPLLARLAALPLFRDCTGAFGHLGAVLAHAPVRSVAPDVSGVPMASRGRVWALGAAERAIVERLRALQDATGALGEETEGAARRASTRGPAPATPRHADVEAVPVPGGGGAVWLQEPASPARSDTGAGIAVRVDGATVEILTPVPGIAGWIEGPFETDAAFRVARLDADTIVALRGAAEALLRREATADPARLEARLGRALAACAHDLDALLGAPLSPWESVPVLIDTTGKAIDLRGIKSALKGRKRLLVGPAGAAPPRKGERVVEGGDATLAQLRGWFPGARVEHVVEGEARRDAKRREDEAKRASGARGKRERALAERAGKLYAAWVGAPAPDVAIDVVIQAWVAGRRPEWPAFATTEADGPWAALIAFAAGLPITADTPKARLALVAGLAEALGKAGA